MIDAFFFGSSELKYVVDKIKQLNKSIPAFKKTFNLRMTHLYNCGEYLQPTEEILADTPSFLTKMPQSETKDWYFCEVDCHGSKFS